MLASMPSHARHAAAAVLLATIASSGGARADEDWHRWHLEAALFPMLTEQQIEGPARDDKLTQDLGVSTALAFSYAPLPWLEPGLWVQLDGGRVRRAVFSRPDATGAARELDVVEGAFWELWAALAVRARFGVGFAEIGYAPLILRRDSVRVDLPNESGETGGTFEGSRSVAFLLGGGLSVPVAEHVDLTARLQFRIRYLVARGGEPLADDEESGQMALWPYVGTHVHF
jgi:hypothetical protein